MESTLLALDLAVAAAILGAFANWAVANSGTHPQRKEAHPMTPQSVASVARQVAAIAAIVLGLIPQIPLPGPWSRAALVLVGGLLTIAEHYVSDPSTGNPVTTTTTTTATAVPVPVAVPSAATPVVQSTVTTPVTQPATVPHTLP